MGKARVNSQHSYFAIVLEGDLAMQLDIKQLIVN